jgi:hypothetical protein
LRSDGSPCAHSELIAPKFQLRLLFRNPQDQRRRRRAAPHKRQPRCGRLSLRYRPRGQVGATWPLHHHGPMRRFLMFHGAPGEPSADTSKCGCESSSTQTVRFSPPSRIEPVRAGIFSESPSRRPRNGRFHRWTHRLGACCRFGSTSLATGRRGVPSRFDRYGKLARFDQPTGFHQTSMLPAVVSRKPPISIRRSV